MLYDPAPDNSATTYDYRAVNEVPFSVVHTTIHLSMLDDDLIWTEYKFDGEADTSVVKGYILFKNPADSAGDTFYEFAETNGTVYYDSSYSEGDTYYVAAWRDGGCDTVTWLRGGTQEFLTFSNKLTITTGIHNLGYERLAFRPANPNNRVSLTFKEPVGFKLYSIDGQLVIDKSKALYVDEQVAPGIYVGVIDEKSAIKFIITD